MEAMLIFIGLCIVGWRIDEAAKQIIAGIKEDS